MATNPPGAWTFRDAAAHAGRSVLTFRTVELADKPAHPLHSRDKPPTGARFGVLPLGVGRKHRLAVVWHAGSGTLWVDANADGRFASDERHTLAADPLKVNVIIPFGTEKRERTLLIRQRGDGLAHAVRGYVAGSLALGGRTYRALLTDGDADGAFDGAAADRLWLDRNQDGKYDPLTEQLPLGRPVAAGSAGYLIRPEPSGDGVVVTERSKQTGTLAARVSRLPGAKVVGLTAQFVSEWGELVTLTAADEPRDVPIGRYRVESLSLKLADADGRTWEYQFAGNNKFAATIENDQTTSIDLTAGLKVSVSVRPGVGREVEVTPEIITAGGLTLTDCKVYEKFAEYGRPIEAVIQLAAPGSETLAESRCGFT
jgi:hypothetical protein